MLVKDKNTREKRVYCWKNNQQEERKYSAHQTLISSRSMEFWSRAAGGEDRLMMKLQVQMDVLLGAIGVCSWLCQFSHQNKAMRWKWRWGIWCRMFEERGRGLKYSSRKISESKVWVKVIIELSHSPQHPLILAIINLWWFERVLSGVFLKLW